MKLHGSLVSPFVRHCRIALSQENIAFEFVEVDYDTSAKNSPTKKVPYLVDGDLLLSDSRTIVKYAREKAGNAYLEDVQDFELFEIANTMIDSAINLFLLENNGLTPDKVPYLSRQQARIDDGLKELNQRIDPSKGIQSDGVIRCVCFIDWAIFRNRISVDGLDNLIELSKIAAKDSVFANTAPDA